MAKIHSATGTCAAGSSAGAGQGQDNTSPPNKAQENASCFDFFEIFSIHSLEELSIPKLGTHTQVLQASRGCNVVLKWFNPLFFSL